MSQRFVLLFGLGLATLIACSRQTPPASSAQNPAAQPADQPTAQPAAETRAEDEVLASLRAEACGAGTIAQLQLPEPYLRRVADRVLRASYFERFRVIVADGQSDEPAPQLPEGPPPPVVQHAHELSEALRSARAAYTEGHPERPGFRARLRSADQIPPQPSERVDTALVPADFVLQRLARDGLLATSAALVAELRAHAKPIDPAALEACGLPIDWLAYFAPPGEPSAGDAQAITKWLEGRVAAGLAPEALASELARAEFTYRPSAPGFRLSSESGENVLAGIRVQLTRGDDWDRPGDGGSVDLVRELVERLPGMPIVASLQSEKLAAFLRTAATWRWDAGRHFDLLLEPGPLAQWAQDNAKTGRDEQGALVLVPRFASRGELGALFVPGESFAPEALQTLGQRVVSSPLFFQGGNLYCCTNPKTGERLLLVGEAELHRNTSLGLAQAQVLAAFRAEFGVDRCVVLPAVSFHIDEELSVRAVGGELVAFVNDQNAAAQMIVNCGLGALAAHGDLSAAELERIRAQLAQKHLAEAFAILSPLLRKGSNTQGEFSQTLARDFQSGAADSGPGNLLRFLAAVDYLSGLSGAGEQPGLEAHTAAYLRSFRRREHDRFTFVRGLESLGMRIVPLPGWPEETLGITPLNGIHERTRYLLPTYGGLYAPLDEACVGILARTLGPEVEIVRLGCAESQRRAGALRCSVSPTFEPPR
ncbi:MAG: hypothetical protein IPJ19_04445 [Planctomycetes bacterium]|nr:hypothetical protein [Planctomycetota bacterium]